MEVDGFVVGALGSWDSDKESSLSATAMLPYSESYAALKPSKAATEYGGRRLADSVYC